MVSTPFVPISADTGLDKVHPTWAGTYILDACAFLFPTINFALIDSGAVVEHPSAKVSLCRRGDGGEGGVNEEPKPASKASKVS